MSDPGERLLPEPTKPVSVRATFGRERSVLRKEFGVFSKHGLCN